MDALKPPIMPTLEDVLNVINIWLRVDRTTVWLGVAVVMLSIKSENSLPPSYAKRNSFRSYFYKENWDYVLVSQETNEKFLNVKMIFHPTKIKEN